MSSQKRFNQKRKIAPAIAQEELNALAERVRYKGSPHHKRNPGDFGLTPPAQPRQHKTLCDGVGITRVADAQRLLREGVLRGLISANAQNGFPKHVWAVTEAGVVVEANYSNEGPGFYHGYPLLESDPFAEIVQTRWNRQ